MKARLFSAILILLLFAFFGVAQQTAVTVFTHDGVVTSAAWNSDETQLLTASEDGFVRLWDVTTGETIWQSDLSAPVGGALWNPDETLVLAWTTSGNTILLNTESGTQTAELPSNNDAPVNGARWHSDGATILVWKENMVSAPTLRGADDFTSARFVLEHESTVLDARWNADETRVLTVELVGIAHVWDATDGTEITTVNLDDETLGVAWSTDLQYVIAWGGNNQVQLFNIETGRGMEAFNHRTFVEGAIWNNDETRIMSWGADDAARIWDAQTGDSIMALRHEDWVTGATWNTDETRILTWSFNTLWLWRADGQLIRTFDHDALVTGASWNSDQTKLLSWSWDGTARIWNIRG